LDSTHRYEETKQELKLLDRKIKDDGMIIGDDWHMNRESVHHGLYLAVNEFLKTANFEIMMCGREMQWVLRRTYCGRF
jgi:hypothetical protein